MIVDPCSLIVARYLRLICNILLSLCVRYVILYQIEKMCKILSISRQYDSLNNKDHTTHSLHVKCKRRVRRRVESSSERLDCVIIIKNASDAFEIENNFPLHF